jgi:hypothetical protein
MLNELKINFILENFLFQIIKVTSFKRVFTCNQKEKCYSKSPKVGHCSLDLKIFTTLEHFWRKIEECSHFSMDEIIITSKRTNSKIYQNCFIIMVNHDILWLDVSMKYLRNVMAIVKCLENVA